MSFGSSPQAHVFRSFNHLEGFSSSGLKDYEKVMYIYQAGGYEFTIR